MNWRALVLFVVLFTGCAVKRMPRVARQGIPTDAINRVRFPEGTTCQTIEDHADWAACDVHGKKVFVHFTRTKVIE